MPRPHRYSAAQLTDFRKSDVDIDIDPAEETAFVRHVLLEHPHAAEGLMEIKATDPASYAAAVREYADADDADDQPDETDDDDDSNATDERGYTAAVAGDDEADDDPEFIA